MLPLLGVAFGMLLGQLARRLKTVEHCLDAKIPLGLRSIARAL